MNKEIYFEAYKPNAFTNMEEIETVKIKNACNYQDDYFIMEIGNKKYMFSKKEFKIAIEDATNF